MIFLRIRPRLAAAAILSLSACGKGPEKEATGPTPAEELPLKVVLEIATSLEDAEFPTIVKATTGRDVLPLPPGSPHLEILSEVFDTTLEVMNSDDSPVRGLRRINEASRFFEDEIQKRLDALADYTCAVPVNAEGEAQRAGYPDLRIEHVPTGEVLYLDPKIYEEGAEKSSLRTFYYQPAGKTSKIRDDACHLLVGIAHDGNDGAWKFLRWRLVDLSLLTVRLKTEFNASNRDLYRDDATLLQSGEETEPARNP